MNTLRLITKQVSARSNLLNYQSKFFASSKIVNTIEEALEGVESNQTLICSGFGICGCPQKLFEGIMNKGIQNLTAVSNTGGLPDWGLGILLNSGQIKKIVASYLGDNKDFEKLFVEGKIEVQLTPQGSIIEKVRAGGAGIPAFYTAAGVHTILETGELPIKFKEGPEKFVVEKYSQPKEKRHFNGKDYILEESIFGDVALIKAWRVDTEGNLQFRKTARNFNPIMAQSAKLTIVEAEEIVEPGVISPDDVHLPGIYVDRVYKPEPYTKKIEKLKFEEEPVAENDAEAQPKTKSEVQLMREKIIKRCAKEVKDGMYINLGVGIPTQLPNFVPKGMKLILQSENGILGMDKHPKKGEEDADLINAGKETVTIATGGSYFDSAQTFAMIRGGHLDLTVLGAMQVSETGDLANWMVPGKKVKGMGGAMDLANSGSQVIVCMEHTNKGTNIKLKKECEYPLTAKGVVNTVITDLAVFKRIDGKLRLVEISEDTTLEEVKAKTGFEIDVKESELGRF